MKMYLIFQNGSKSECEILKETKKYITFRCKGNLMKYRYNKETKEVQDGTYNRKIDRMHIVFE